VAEPTPFRLNDLVLAECDVDVADLRLPLSSTTKEESEFRSGEIAVIDEERCIGRTVSRSSSAPR
jgi:MinD superfamily P-loop ATPase